MDPRRRGDQWSNGVNGYGSDTRSRGASGPQSQSAYPAQGGQYGDPRRNQPYPTGGMGPPAQNAGYGGQADSSRYGAGSAPPMNAHPGSALPSDPRVRPQDPRLQVKQEPVATPPPPPASVNAVAGPSATSTLIEAENAGNGKGKQRPLFCVVCASNNVCPPASLKSVRLMPAESIHGGAHGLGVSERLSR